MCWNHETKSHHFRSAYPRLLRGLMDVPKTYPSRLLPLLVNCIPLNEPKLPYRRYQSVTAHVANHKRGRTTTPVQKRNGQLIAASKQHSGNRKGECMKPNPKMATTALDGNGGYPSTCCVGLTLAFNTMSQCQTLRVNAIHYS